MPSSRMPVYCVDAEITHPPLALGMVLAAASRSAPLYQRVDALSEALQANGGAGAVLFSDYNWCIKSNLAISSEIKRRFPSCVTVHGGPDIPKEPLAGDAFMKTHPHIDITVNGEGELTFPELLRALEEEPERIERVDGITFRPAPGQLVRTKPRERVRDLDTLSSPYLTGLFDGHAHSRWRAAILETNRGCPYGCTFCDWGSATLQKIRTFGLDRLEAEIEWIARHKLAIVFVADANFGIFQRDVQIAEMFARAKQRFGYPRQIVVNYAKNATDRVAEIIRIFVRAEMTATGIISLQTTDPVTLEAIDRKNIKTSRYEDLIEIFRRERLPISTDYMLGLPAQTVPAVKRDLQFAFDWALSVKFYQSQMLVNSPMARPEYVQLHGLRTDHRGYVTSTRAMNEADAERARRLCLTFQISVESGLMRYLLYFLEEEYGLEATDVLERLIVDLDRPELAPFKRVFDSMYSFGPFSLGQLRYRSSTLRTRWSRVYAALSRYLVARYGVREDSALGSILAAQRALMPRVGRVHPRKVTLEHDVVAYFRDLGIGYRGYLDPARPKLALASYPPGELEIADPERTCWSIPELRMTYDSHHVPFELESPLKLESVRTRFIKKREVFVLKFERSRVGKALQRALKS